MVSGRHGGLDGGGAVTFADDLFCETQYGNVLLNVD